MGKGKGGESGSKGGIRSFVDSMPIGDYAEIAVDAACDSEVLKELPVVSTIAGFWNAAKVFKKKRFERRVERFHSQVADLTDEQWKDFEEKLESDGQTEEFISDLLALMDRLDDEQKALMVGGLFKRLVRKEISIGHFQQLSRVVEVLSNADIHLFMHGYRNHAILEDGLGDILLNVRVCKRSIENAQRQIQMLDPNSKESYIKTTYTITGFGEIFLESLHRVYEDKIQEDHLFRRK